MSAITAKASRKMKKYAVLTREPRCFLGSFDFSWEQRKAIDIADYSKGNGYSKGDLTDAGTPIILYGRLYTKYQFAISEVDTFAFPRNGAVYSQGNEVIVPASGETAEDIARASAVEKSGVLLGGDLNILRPFDFINPLFLALAISNGEPQKELAKKAQGKSVVHIHNTDIQEVTIAYPSRTEQDRIVSVFRQLDNLITLHQRKCANLCSPSQVVFSLLFATSTFSWEQRKLGDIASDMVAGGDIDKDLILAEGQYPVIANALTGDGIVGYYDKEYRVNAPAVTVTGRGDVGHAKARLVNFTPVVRLLSVKSEHDVFFLENAINTLKIVIESTGVPQLTVPQLAKYEVAFPRQLDEEEHIGAFFKQLDHLITLHQRECISFNGRADRLILTANKKRTTSSWEQRKAKEICSIGTGKSNTQDQVDDGKYPFYIRSDVPVRSNKYLYDCEAVITIGDGNIGKVFHYVNGKFDLHQRCYKMTDFKDIWGKYFFYYFSTKFYDRAMKMTAKATVDSVRLEMISEMDIKKPPQISEQKQIAEFFANLDNLITLHQRKPFLMKWRTSDANRNQTNRLVL